MDMGRPEGILGRVIALKAVAPGGLGDDCSPVIVIQVQLFLRLIAIRRFFFYN